MIMRNYFGIISSSKVTLMTLLYSWNVSRYLTRREPWFTGKINRYAVFPILFYGDSYIFHETWVTCNRRFHSLFYPQWSWSWGAGYYILHPALKKPHVSIHSESIFTRTTNCKADDTHKIPLVISQTDQRSSTVSCACVNFFTRVTCTAHAFGNANLDFPVWFATSFTWYKRNFGLLQNLKKKHVVVYHFC